MEESSPLHSQLRLIQERIKKNKEIDKAYKDIESELTSFISAKTTDSDVTVQLQTKMDEILKEHEEIMREGAMLARKADNVCIRPTMVSI
jgi:hypothetical protein